MVTPPCVTIVIASRDRAAFARRAVSSAVAQVDATVDVVVVDDGSERRLDEALADLVDASSGRLRILRNDRAAGVAVARNRGLAEADGDWVGFCDDDDVWAPWKVRDQLGPASSDALWTCSGAMAVDRRLQCLYAMRTPDVGDGLGDRLLTANLIPGGASSVIARTEAVRAESGFDPSFSTLADWELWIRLARLGPLFALDRPLVGYLVHPLGLSNDTSLLEQDMARLRTKHRLAFERAGISGDHHLWASYVGYRHLASGRRSAAARTFARSAWTNRSATQAAGAAASLLSPQRAVARRADLATSQVPDDWAVEVRSWLAGVEPV